MSISGLHFLFANLTALGLIIYAFASRSVYVKAAAYFLTVPLLGLSLLLVYRVDGVDFGSYRQIYFDPFSMAWDPGWAYLNHVFHEFFEFGFPEFMLFIFVCEMFLYREIAKTLRIKFALFMSIYVLHLFIVRDLAQVRIGFAVAIVLYGLICQNGYKRLFILCIGISIHLTSSILVWVFLTYYFVQRASRFRLSHVTFVSSVLIIFVVSQTIENIAAFDQRVAIYTNWNAPGYGAAVDNYLPAVFYIFYCFIAWINFNFVKSDFNFFSLISGLLVIIVFISFDSHQIMASRLANVVGSAYPLSVAWSLQYLGNLVCIRSRKFALKIGLLRMSLLIFISMLLIRPGSAIIVADITPGLFLPLF